MCRTIPPSCRTRSLSQSSSRVLSRTLPGLPRQASPALHSPGRASSRRVGCCPLPVYLRRAAGGDSAGTASRISRPVVQLAGLSPWLNDGLGFHVEAALDRAYSTNQQALNSALPGQCARLAARRRQSNRLRRISSHPVDQMRRCAGANTSTIVAKLWWRSMLLSASNERLITRR